MFRLAQTLANKISLFLLLLGAGSCSKLWMPQTALLPTDAQINESDTSLESERVRAANDGLSATASGRPSPEIRDNDSAEEDDQDALLKEVPAPSWVNYDFKLEWEVPKHSSSPISYRFLWGSKSDNLSNSIEVSVKELTAVQHPLYGPVYRYVMRNLNICPQFFVSIVAVFADGSTQASPPLEVQSPCPAYSP